MEKVTVYRTSDGQYFSLEHEDMAKRHQARLDEGKEIDEIFGQHEEAIKEHVFKNLRGDLRDHITEAHQIGVHHYGENGWDCNGKGNPIKTCVYSFDTYMEDDMCVFCGEPEERK